MTLEVLKVFADKLTYRMYAVGQQIEVEDEARANEMIEKGFAKSLETKAEPKKATAKAKTTAKKTAPKSGKRGK